MEFVANDTVDVSFEDCSLPFIGRWTRLVSTTNWDKGLIIHQWRQALIAAGAPATEYSDEAWSSRVGGVSPQHVGRLRRVHDRFADLRDQFRGLFWSHFQAAIDWDDAEMWLEGATQNEWSVAQMRNQRWEALEGPNTQPPKEEQDASADWDEDAALSEAAERMSPEQAANAIDFSHDPVSPAGTDFGDDEDVPRTESAADYSSEGAQTSDLPSPLVRPFENLPDLPEDLQEAFEAFKVCIVKYKADEWHTLPLSSVLHTLDALKHFAASS